MLAWDVYADNTHVGSLHAEDHQQALATARQRFPEHADKTLTVECEEWFFGWPEFFGGVFVGLVAVWLIRAAGF